VAPTPTVPPGVIGSPVPTATTMAIATRPPGTIVSAKDSITLVIEAEPPNLDPIGSGGGISSAITKDNVVDPLTWQAADDQRIIPTTATESWQQVDADTWRFQLRTGVKFHNGEAWNAQAALPSLAYQGIGTNDNLSFPYTGGFKAEAVGEYTLDLNCDQPCPVFPNTALFLNFSAPRYYGSTPEAEYLRKAMGFGPYKQVRWDPAVAITLEAYDDYVPAGAHFEFQEPYIRNARWLFRGEATVMAAMVKTAEADIAWDVGVDAIQALNKDQIRSGGSAEVFTLDINTLWHPELKKKQVRQAMAHAINCQEMINSLYGGHSVCRGNIIWPGVIGATERNTAPYEYNPTLARQLLQEANYNPNNKITLLGRGTRIPKQVEVYEAIQGYLKAVGINVEINIIEVQTLLERRNCRIGKAVQEVLEAQGKDPQTATPTTADFQAALAKGGANCPTADLIENEPSNETLDFGRQASFYLNCTKPQAPVCDPSPGGFQEQLGPALAASGEERRRRLEALADRVHEDVLWMPAFDLPVIYAVNPKLNYQPRFDRRVRLNTMWFSR
jgi:peptide/nickel transport system substrate-binding protein